MPQNKSGDRPSAEAAALWSVLDDMPARISFIDRDRRHRYINREYADLIGMAPEAAIGRTVADIMGEEEDARLREFSERALAGETVRWEGWAEIPRGVHRYIHRVYKPHVNPDGQIVGFFVLVRDTTEQQEALQEQQRLTRLFEDAIAGIPNGFGVYNAAQRLVLCNEAYAAMYDAKPAELIGKSLKGLRGRLLGLVKSVDGRPVADAHRIFGPNLDRLYALEGRAIEIEFTDGQWLLMSRHKTGDGGFVFVRTDITELKQMQEALRESEAMVRTVLDSSPIPITMTRADDGERFYSNPAAHDLLGFDPENSNTPSVDDVYVDPADRQTLLKLLESRGAVSDLETHLKRTDGSPFWAAVSARQIEYKGETVIVASVIDLTERRAVEAELSRQREALHQSEKLNALGGLLAGVAHELKNPLSVVVGQALLLQDTTRDPDVKQRAERIGNAADRCARIVKTFLAMARQSEPEHKEVSLNDIVRSALEITAYALRSSGIEVVCDLAEDLPPVYADPDQLGQVAMNLIVNAEQALVGTVGERTLSIRTDSDEGMVRLRVSDNGPGIPPEVLSRVFEPFFTTKEFGIGTGVGLTVSRGIIEAHDGRIEVDSSKCGGAAFTVLLPPASPAPHAVAEAPRPVGAVGPRRILVIDDEPEVAEMLADCLALDGHEVVTANSGSGALRLLAKDGFDLILSDMRMPDVDGPGLYLRIKNAYPELLQRLVFITGDALGPSIASFFERTGLPHLEKPITPDEVRHKVREVLAAAG